MKRSAVAITTVLPGSASHTLLNHVALHRLMRRARPRRGGAPWGSWGGGARAAPGPARSRQPPPGSGGRRAAWTARAEDERDDPRPASGGLPCKGQCCSLGVGLPLGRAVAAQASERSRTMRRRWHVSFVTVALGLAAIVLAGCPKRPALAP